MTAIDAQATPDPHGDAHGHDDHHDHPEHLAHHWDNLEQQFNANKLGMWLFLATEFLLFGGLFVAYAVFRNNQPELFQWGSQFLDTFWGAVNTVVLIASSFTMAMAVWAAQKGMRNLLVWMLALTFLGGMGFMVIKYFEYTAKFEKNIFPGAAYYTPAPEKEKKDGGEGASAYIAGEGANGEGGVDGVTTEPAEGTFVLDSDDPELPQTDLAPGAGGPRGLARDPDLEPRVYNPYKPQHHSKDYPDHVQDLERPANAHLFFSIYYCMTGIHAIHILAGIGVLTWLLVRSVRHDFNRQYFGPVDYVGLYWHIVDLIWIYLFPLLYLIR